MIRDADIVVVGGGIVGAATARALAGGSGAVVLLEQFELGHAHGSSHGTSRIFRLNYPDERFVRLAQAASTAWRELEETSGQTLIDRTGSLDIGPVATETARAFAACGVPFETLSADEVALGGPSSSRRTRRPSTSGRAESPLPIVRTPRSSLRPPTAAWRSASAHRCAHSRSSREVSG